MIRCFWLLNHRITEEQKSELKNKYNVGAFIFPPDSISRIWAAVPPVNYIPEQTLNEILSWFDTAESSDIAVVQGESTVSFRIVNYLMDNGITVLASVSDRCSEEHLVDGKLIKTSSFKHICFRKYER